MAKRIDVIEFNGQTYDAGNGQKLGSNPSDRPKHSLKAKAVQPHQQLKSKTLMRRAVKKPVASIPASPSQASPLAQKLAARKRRASQINLSRSISHFGDHQPANWLAPLDEVDLLANTRLVVQASQPVRQPLNRQEQASRHIEKSLHLAPAHQLKSPRQLKVSHKLIAAAGSGLLVIIVATTYLVNQPAIKLHLAEARSQIGINLGPQAGASLQSISYSPGKITASFSDSSGSYSLKAVKSLWNDQDLTGQFLAGVSYQTLSLSGQTVYLYGQASATWLKNGVWYVVNNQAGLNLNQLGMLVGRL